MAKFFGDKSDYLSRKKRENKFWAYYAGGLIFLSILPPWIFLFYYKFSFIQSIIADISIILISFLLWWAAKDRIHAAYCYKKGIRGESKVYFELMKLSNEYTVIQDVKLPDQKWNIDFVVIGPTGIYAIEVKNIDGEIGYNEKFLTCKGKMMEGKNVIDIFNKEYFGLRKYLFNKTNEELFVNPLIVLANQYPQVHFGCTPVVSNIRVFHVTKLIEFITSQAEYYYKVPRKMVEEKIIELATSK